MYAIALEFEPEATYGTSLGSASADRGTNDLAGSGLELMFMVRQETRPTAAPLSKRILSREVWRASAFCVGCQMNHHLRLCLQCD